MGIDEAINGLSAEELDLLNSDQQMLADFKKKYSTQPPKAPSLASEASQYVQKQGSPMKSVAEVASGMTNLVNPAPFMPTMSNPVPNIPQELEKKRQFVEGAADQVKRSSEGSVGNMVETTSKLASRYLPKPLATGVNTLATILGGAVNTATALAPFKPSEFANEAAGAILPAAASQAMSGVSKRMANRFIDAPKGIREARLEAGQPTVGEELLKVPKDKADLITSNKVDIFNRAKAAVSVLKDKVDKTIASTKNAPAIRSQEIADSIDSTINEVIDGFGKDSAEANQLINFKKVWLSGRDEFLDFKQANALREKLGDIIGKRFEKMTQDLPEKTYALRQMWSTLRNKIGQISPEIDEMLQLQHNLLDIKNSVKSAASKGYTSTPDTFVGMLKTPGRSIKGADILANQLPREGSALGAVIASGANQANNKNEKTSISNTINRFRKR